MVWVDLESKDWVSRVQKFKMQFLHSWLEMFTANSGPRVIPPKARVANPNPSDNFVPSSNASATDITIPVTVSSSNASTNLQDVLVDLVSCSIESRFLQHHVTVQ